ncbi:MAG: enoyl-CoA hydratase/isomerase family protein [Gemmatimonadales bacterium]
MTDELLSQIEGPALQLTLNRPERRNALTPELTEALARAIAAAPQQSGIRAIVLRGAGGHFCVGLDLRWLVTLGPTPSREVVREGLSRFQSAVRAIARSPLPVIAVLEGSVAGFGLELAAACDLRLAAPGTSITSAFARMGLVPDGGSTFTLPRLVGSGRALRFLTAGETLDAATAQRIGLVDEVSEDARLETRVAELVEGIASGAEPSVRAIKRLCREADLEAFDKALEREAQAQLEALQGAEFKQRLQAFLTKSSTPSELR